MIGRGFLRGKVVEDSEVASFDTYELRLGDLMRGERATLGKTLLDVQRELKIKAAYIAAIENADPSAFDTPGFIAGYVRSYARYLNMDPDWAFDTFCRESGFATAHGMSAAASTIRPQREGKEAPGGLGGGLGKDIFAGAPFLPAAGGLLSGVEPRAVGSILVLATLLAGLSYGGWMILREVQKVTFAPVEQAPTVVAEVDPLAGGSRPAPDDGAEVASLVAPSQEALDRLYRPQALDVPVLVPRDGPIAALDPRAGGATPRSSGGDRPVSLAVAAGGPAPLAAPGATTPGVEAVLAGVVAPAAARAVPTDAETPAPAVQVTAGPAPELQLVAVREAWVRVTSADGSTIYEGILTPGETFDVPATEEPPTMRVGESGALYMALNGVPYGPVGPAGAVTSDVALSAQAVAQTYAVADLSQDSDLAEYVSVASAAGVLPAAVPAGGTPSDAGAAAGPTVWPD